MLQILAISELQVEIQVCPLVLTVVWLGIRAVTLIPRMIQELPSQPSAYVR